ncbi:MCE family protein [Actinomadura darangshiensis]|uniref:MCE family protein n=1 Tax=Actinomadura darangshiensis TaxID=705336 RepID=A0A4R5AXF2_9ACTN|nr:MCE family protein [Actinomadura darangshiensis]TDD76709.1 MCE family protein [Actinomadura darangshiensis]
MSDETLSSRSRTIFGLVGAGVIAAAAAFVAIGSTPSHAGSTYYDATFGRAGQGLDPGKSEVKIRGIAVGAVDDLKLDDNGRVTVRLRVDKGVKIADSAVATVEPVSVFGPKDLALDLGAHELTGPYLEDGGRIAKTNDPQELSDTAWPAYRLTKAINPDDVATLLHTFGAGLSGQGEALRRTVDNGAIVVDATYKNRAAIQSLLADINGLSGTFASRGDTITGFAGDFNRLSQTINERPDKVTQLLDESSRLGQTLGSNLQQHGRNLGGLIDTGGGLADALNDQIRNVPVLLDSLNGFFALLSQIIRIPGPEGTLIAQARDDLPLDICQIFVDACSKTPSKTAFQMQLPGTGKRP